MFLHAVQIKAARAILDWSQEDLANASGLSVATIRNLETGSISLRSSAVIRRVIEGAGLEFTEYEGIRRRADAVKVFQGPDSCDQLFEDILQTIKEKSGTIEAVLKSQRMMLCSFGETPNGNYDRLKKINEHTYVKCLLTGSLDTFLMLPKFQFKTIAKQYAGPVAYYVYGDKHVLVLPEGEAGFKFVVFYSIELAQSYRQHFLSLWDTASALIG